MLVLFASTRVGDERSVNIVLQRHPRKALLEELDELHAVLCGPGQASADTDAATTSRTRNTIRELKDGAIRRATDAGNVGTKTP